MTGRSWTLTFTGSRPWTVNGERKLSHFERAALVSEWRKAFAWLARERRIPALAAVRVRAHPLVANRRSLQDVGGCLPAVKAAVDGLVDAGVLADDGPAFLRELVFTGPVLGEVDGLVLVVEEVG